MRESKSIYLLIYISLGCYPVGSMSMVFVIGRGFGLRKRLRERCKELEMGSSSSEMIGKFLLPSKALLSKNSEIADDLCNTNHADWCIMTTSASLHLFMRLHTA